MRSKEPLDNLIFQQQMNLLTREIATQNKLTLLIMAFQNDIITYDQYMEEFSKMFKSVFPLTETKPYETEEELI